MATHDLHLPLVMQPGPGQGRAKQGRARQGKAAEGYHGWVPSPTSNILHGLRARLQGL